MGRWVEVWGLSFERLRAQGKAASLPFLREWAERLGVSKEQALVALDRLMAEPEKGSPDEWSDWRFSCPDIRHLSHHQPTRFQEMGFVLLFETSATNPSCVFMEQFADWREETQTVVERSEDAYSYLVQLADMRRFCRRLLALLEFFLYKNHDEYDYLQYLDPEQADAEELRAWAEAFYEQQVQYRNQDPQRYSEKWATDYFAFAYQYESIQKIFDKTSVFDRFLILDSY